MSVLIDLGVMKKSYHQVLSKSRSSYVYGRSEIVTVKITSRDGEQSVSRVVDMTKAG